jgi:hypothetical protein
MVYSLSRCSLSALGVFATATGAGEPVRAQTVGGSSAPVTRIVHRFDFDERSAGNLEDVPKYWDSLRLRRFPHYAYGAFDLEVGRLAPPSFHLTSEGRNVAYQYAGPETRVRRNTDYRIEGFIRPGRLAYARACLSAHFLDRHGRSIPGTLVRSRYVGGPGESADWVRVELYLAAAPRGAYSISLVAWVLQEPLWRDAVPLRRHIPRNDVRGGAWFDDIVIYALPHVELASSAPGNVLAPGGSQTLHVVLADDEDPTLYGRLSIRAADGGLVERHRVSVVLDWSAAPVNIDVGHLSPGLYRARLDVIGGQTVIVSRELVFARVGALNRRPERLARSFGVVVDPRHRSDPAVELALLHQQAVRSAKLPVWTGLPTGPPTARQRRAMSRLFHDLVKRGFSMTGVFFGPPGAIARSDGAYVRRLLDLLAGDPETWREHLAAVVVPYASAFGSWQVGPDPPPDDILSASNEQRTVALTQLRDAMHIFITTPRLGVPATTAIEPVAGEMRVGEVTLALAGGISPDWYGSQIDRYKALGYDKVSVYLDPLPSGAYRRLPRLADWAQRIIVARHAGADSVFVPQLWRVRDTPQGQITEPTEEYIVLRTIADILADARPGPRIHLADGVWALAFNEGESTTLAMWDPTAPPGGRSHVIQLGRADRQLDLWGRSATLPRARDGRHIVRLTPLPVFVPGVERWLVDFRSSLVLNPNHVESGVELARHTVDMVYQGDRPLSGRLVFDPPESWQVQPRSFTFNLMPQRIGSHPIKVRYPHNEPAGTKNVVAKITLAQEGYYLELPLVLEVSVTDLDVWGMASMEGNELLLRHVVSNRSSKVLNFRGSATVPGRERQYRPISHLQPGDTQTVEYRFARSAELIGRTVRLVLREIDGGSRIHNLELTVP